MGDAMGGEALPDTRAFIPGESPRFASRMLKRTGEQGDSPRDSR
jgi:hypothetical protein